MRGGSRSARNRRRSPTAEAIFQAEPGVEAWSAGTAPDAEEVISPDHLAWADTVYVMEDRHRRAVERIAASLPKDRRPPIRCLRIPDDYEFMDAELVRLIRERIRI